MKKTVRIIILIAFFMVLGVIGIVGGKELLHKQETVKSNATLLTMRPIPTIQVKQHNQAIQRLFPGTVKAVRQVDLSFSVSGQLRKLNAKKGIHINKGSVLASLDQRDFEHALASAKANYLKAQLTFSRMKRLHEKNIISRANFEKARADFDTAQSELKIREKALEDTVLIAPFDSIIADRHVENYEHISAHKPILSLYDMSEIEVVIQVPESLIRDYSPSEWCNIEVKFNAEKHSTFSAVLQEFQLTPDSMTGTYDITFLIRPQLTTRSKLLPGMTATVCFLINNTNNNSNNKIIIPSQATRSDNSGSTYVWVINPDGGLPHKRAIIIGNRYNQNLEVISGLKAGEFIAIAGIQSISGDQPVRPQKPGKDGLEG